jgi:copper chaperone CopZ
VEFIIEGMSCEACVRHLSGAWSGTPGVLQVGVDLAAGRGTVTGDVDPAMLIAIAADEGYVARLA